MADHGQRAAEEAQAKVARRLKSIYGEAVKDLDKQLKAYTDKYAMADTKMRAKLAEGKITDAQYAAWKRGQVFTGDLWRKKRDMLAGTMYDADVLAQRIINGERLNVFAENMNSMAYDMEHGEGVDMGFGYYDSSTVARLLAEDPDMLPAPRVKKDKDTTWYRSKVNNVVTKGIIMGSSIPDMASEIARETGEMAYKAALRNARTAMTGAQNAGRIEAMEQAQSMGIKVQKRWMSTLDGRTRDAHRDLDGQVQDVDKPFESDLGDIMFPGDPHAHPGNLYNCRCTLVYVHPEYPSNLPRRDQITGEVIEDMSYREWEKSKQNRGRVYRAAEEKIWRNREEYQQARAKREAMFEEQKQNIENWYQRERDKLSEEYGGPFIRQRIAVRQDDTLSELEKETKLEQLRTKEAEFKERRAVIGNEYNKRQEDAIKEYASVFDPEYEYPKIVGKPSIVDNARAVNPNWSLSRYEYTVNCQRCGVTFELRERGYDVEAMAAPEGGVGAGGIVRSIFRDAEEYTFDGRGHENTLRVREKMYEWGEGSRCVIQVDRDGGGGHIFNAQVRDGKLWIVDGQLSAAWNDAEKGMNVDGGALEESSVFRVTIYRTDNTRIYDIPFGWVKGAQK